MMLLHCIMYLGIYLQSILAPANNKIASQACGGLINLPSVGGFVVVDYKAAVSYENNEKCIWTINNRIGSYRVVPNMYITMLLNGFEAGADVLEVLYKSSNIETFDDFTLSNSVAVSFYHENVFLSFHSDGSVQGTGFFARIDLFSVPAVSVEGNNYFYSSSSTRTISYGPYGNVDVTSIVINPSSPTISPFTFSITALDTEASATIYPCQYDRIEVYEIISGSISRRAKLCGVNSLVESSFRTIYPVVALFVSDSSNTGTGFTVNW